MNPCGLFYALFSQHCPRIITTKHLFSKHHCNFSFYYLIYLYLCNTNKNRQFNINKTKTIKNYGNKTKFSSWSS